MAKYRLLTTDELKHFEKEFIDFLVINGIDADSWEVIKVESPQKAGQIIDLFSDVVFEQVLRQVFFLEKVDDAVLQFVKCGDDHLELIALKRKSLQTELKSIPLKKIKFEDVDIIKGSKDYQEIREIDIFNMITQGYSPSKGEGWEHLKEHLSHD